MTEPTLEYLVPPEPIADLVSFFYEFRTYTDTFKDIDRADYAQLRFTLRGGNGVFHFIDGHVQNMPLIYVLGPTTGNTIVTGEGHIDLFGAGLLPAGWAAIMPMDASAAVNRAFDAVDLFGPKMLDTFAQLQNASGISERVAIGTKLIQDLTQHLDKGARAFTRLVDDWLSGNPSPDVDELIRCSGLSRRQVERNCNRFYGAPPKLLARKYRALRAAIKLAKGHSVPDDLIANGFYDQSHFIRELKYFTGMTPTTISGNLPILTQLTLRRTELEGESPLLRST